ncbi:MFS transporter [Kineosporia mesophila]|uniref:MFS transporter n=1 Tax=Kineosporia mesophila TaxID=566012 RepID=UPI001E2B287F|nr:MFS transporter [Kineosporia mesophila]MCD5349686.1 MFS transporter [Kineosporia mesophila]
MAQEVSAQRWKEHVLGELIPAPAPLWKLDGIQWLLTAGSLLNAIAFFSALPFASLYLDAVTDLSAVVIGGVVGGIALIASVGGMLGGLLIDRFGAVPLMLLGLVGYVLIYAGLAQASTTAAIVPLLLGLGAARLLVEPGGKKLMSLAADPDGRIFRVRYMVLCAGAIVGPAIGGVLYTTSITAFFAVPAVFYTAYLVFVVLFRARLTALETARATSAGRFPLREALRDRRLLAASGAGIVIFFVFSQLDSMIPLFMAREWGDRAAHLFAGLFIANAVLALVFQMPIAWLSDRVPRARLILAGCVGFALAFGCFWASASLGLPLLYLGIVLWTLGEGVLLPLPDIAVHELADDDRKGTYFGVAEIRYLGFFAGPSLGGVMLPTAGLYFTVMGLAVFACVPLLAGRLPRRSR